MSIVGSVARFQTSDGKIVSALAYEERSNLPVFSVEIVDADGEVVDCFDVIGHYALMNTAQRRHWTPYTKEQA